MVTDLKSCHARLRYNWAIALQRLNAPEKAEQAYLEAIERAPENVWHLHALYTAGAV